MLKKFALNYYSRFSNDTQGAISNNSVAYLSEEKASLKVMKVEHVHLLKSMIIGNEHVFSLSF